MSFVIKHTDTLNLSLSNIVIQDYTTDTSTSLALLGRGVANYGESMASNLLHLLENSANSSPPLIPIAGQLWYDTAGILNVSDGTNWHSLLRTDAAVNQQINITGDATGYGTTAIALALSYTGVIAGTYSNIIVDAKGRLTYARPLNLSDISTAVNNLITNAGVINSTNLTITNTLPILQSTSITTTQITFADNSVQTSAPASLAFLPIHQGLPAPADVKPGTNTIYIGWDGSGLTTQVDATKLNYLVTSSSVPPILTIQPCSTNGTGGRIILNNVAPGEDLVIDVYGGITTNDNSIRMFRSNYSTNDPIFYFNCDTGVLAGLSNVKTSLYDVNYEIGLLKDQVNNSNQAGSFLPTTGANTGLSGQIGNWDSTYTNITSYLNIFAKNALVAPTLLSQICDTTTVNASGAVNAAYVHSSGAIEGVALNSYGGNIQANGARLRANYGATGTNDSWCATILADFYSVFGNNGYQHLPNGLIIQWFYLNAIGDGVTRLFNFPTAFSTVCLIVFASYGSDVPPGTGNIGVATQGNSPYQFRVNSNVGSYGSNGCSIFAIGW